MGFEDFSPRKFRTLGLNICANLIVEKCNNKEFGDVFSKLF